MMTQTLAEDIRSALGETKVDTSEAALNARRHDYWVASHVRDFAGTPGPTAACVVRPANVADVQAVLRIANARQTPVIPFGLGSGVVGGSQSALHPAPPPPAPSCCCASDLHGQAAREG